MAGEPRRQIGESLDEYMNWKVGAETCMVEESIILGQGQFGEVRLGKWYGSRVAVKKLRNYDIEENEHLFEKEVRLMKELHHPCIVQFLGFSTEPSLGGLAIIMEYLPNGSVEDYILGSKRRISLKQRQMWCSEMAQGLAYLHNRKPDFLIHRDVKPSNFMLTQSLVCKLGDFGISRLFSLTPVPPKTGEVAMNEGSDSPKGTLRSSSQRINSGGAFNAVGALLGLITPENELEQTCNVGTSRYMAPEVREQLQRDERKSKYSVQVDIFSLGMVYYFVFESTPPRIEGATNPTTYHAALRAGKRPLFRRTPEPMRRIIRLCLGLYPVERPTSRELIVLLDGAHFPKKRVLPCALRVQPADQPAAFAAAEALYLKIGQRKLTGASGSRTGAPSGTPNTEKESEPGSPPSCVIGGSTNPEPEWKRALNVPNQYSETTFDLPSGVEGRDTKTKAGAVQDPKRTNQPGGGF